MIKTFAARSFRAIQLGLFKQPKKIPANIELYGYPLDGTYQMIVRNAYGNFILEALLDAPSNAMFLDIGANIGMYSILLAQHFKPPVISFEPNARTFYYLQRNLAHADLKEVMAYCAGIHATDEVSAFLNLKPMHSGAASITHTFKGKNARISLIGPTLLSRLIGQEERQLVAKIDVEGAELSVVQALVSSGLITRFERIVIEMSTATNTPKNLDEIRAMLSKNGLHLKSRRGSDFYADELFVRS